MLGRIVGIPDAKEDQAEDLCAGGSGGDGAGRATRCAGKHDAVSAARSAGDSSVSSNVGSIAIPTSKSLTVSSSKFPGALNNRLITDLFFPILSASRVLFSCPLS